MKPKTESLGYCGLYCDDCADHSEQLADAAGQEHLFEPIRDSVRLT